MICTRVWDSTPIAWGLRLVTLAVALINERAFWAGPSNFWSRSPICSASHPCPNYSPSPYPFLQFWTGDFQLLDLHPFWGTPKLIALVFTQHLACIAALIALQWVLDRGRRRAAGAAPTA